ncbi:MAG: NFACT RNA binding domain-containing protein [Bacteroidia bacterium]
MLAHFWYYQIWSNRLSRLLEAARFDYAISFDKDNLYLEFSTGVLWCRFVHQELWLQWLDELPSRNAQKRHNQVQFKSKHGQSVLGVRCQSFDRWIEISLADGSVLGIKGFGRQSNVLAIENNEVISIFRLSQKGDWDFKSPLPGLWPNQMNLVGFSWETHLRQRHWPQSAWNQVPWNALESRDEQSVLAWLLGLSDAVLSPIPDAQTALELIWGDWTRWTLPEQTQEWARTLSFQEEKARRLAHLEQRIRQLNAGLEKNRIRLSELETRRSYKELGDLILSHAHHIHTGVSSVRLPDFYTGEYLRIKLDPKLAAAENAQRYYRKAKNEPMEIEERRNQLQRMSLECETCKQQLERVLQASSFKDFRKEKAPVVYKTNAVNEASRPFKVIHWGDYQIWMGKSAKSNDELLRAAAKQDLWFHAKGVTGSHVLIRRTGLPFSSEVMAHAAKLAAENSKAKHQGFVSVQYTLRKYVVKPKGAEPGLVHLLQEETMDVFL